MVRVAGPTINGPALLERIKPGLPVGWYGLLGLARSLTCFERKSNVLANVMANVAGVT